NLALNIGCCQRLIVGNLGCHILDLGAHLLDCRQRCFSGDAGCKSRRTPVGTAGPTKQRHAASLGFTGAVHGTQNFRSVGVDYPAIDRHLAFALLGPETAYNAAEAANVRNVSTSHAAYSAHVHALVFKTELGDGANYDGIDAEQFTDFAGSGRIGSVTDREVLLFQE